MQYRNLIRAAVLAGTVVAAGAAEAATSAIATADVNLRAGPSTRYPVVDVIGDHDNVTVYGCLASRSWCDVSYRGARGWMSSNYLAYITGGRRYVGSSFAALAPVIAFSFGNYWDNHYRGRHFYHRYRHDRRWDRHHRRDHDRHWNRHHRRDHHSRHESHRRWRHHRHH